MVDCVNVPMQIAYVLSRDKSLMPALGSTLGLEDLYDLIEVMRVDDHNKAAIDRARNR
jgi:hypothetical protein